MNHSPIKKTVLIDRHYSLSFAVRFSAMALLSFTFFAVCVYLGLNRRLGVGYLEDISTLSRLQENFLVILLVTGTIQAVVLSAIFLVLSLLWAHAIAGPLVRFRRSLTSLTSDSPFQDMSFREKDQLHLLAETFRNMQQSRKISRERFVKCLKKADVIIQEYESLEKEKKLSFEKKNFHLASLTEIYEEMRGLTWHGNKN